MVVKWESLRAREYLAHVHFHGIFDIKRKTFFFCTVFFSSSFPDFFVWFFIKYLPLPYIVVSIDRALYIVWFINESSISFVCLIWNHLKRTECHAAFAHHHTHFISHYGLWNFNNVKIPIKSSDSSRSQL